MTPADDNTPKVRTRFPPSPTGALHLGGARTALFNWLFARHHGGEFVLRLEDTDRQRSKPEHVDSILAAMDWLGLDFDEGPYYQTQRFERYRQVIDQMLDKGRAYWCHCPPEELDRRRKEAMAKGEKPMYDGACRDKGLGPAPGAVVRFKGPCEGQTAYDDKVKGPISFGNAEMDDLVILRSDGSPTYHLAVVVDDVDMGITHVIRGDDHVSNTPRQILLYRAMDAEPPVFAHVPMILGPDKKRLSKRHGATSVMEYQGLGFLPEAMVNALARLGWSHGDQEVFTRQELIQFFGLGSVGKSAAVFDQDKLTKLNSRYIQNADHARLMELSEPFIAAKGLPFGPEERRRLELALEHLTPRANTLVELVHAAEPFLVDMPQMDPKAQKKFLKPDNAPVLQKVRDLAASRDLADMAGMEQAFKDLAADMGLKLGAIAQPTRVALTGRTFSPGIFEVMAILGAGLVLKRLDAALALANTGHEEN